MRHEEPGRKPAHARSDFERRDRHPLARHAQPLVTDRTRRHLRLWPDCAEPTPAGLLARHRFCVRIGLLPVAKGGCQMSETAKTVNNGVNVEALLGAREALTNAPEAAQFKWRAACQWKNGTHSHSTVESFYGLGEEQRRKKTFAFDADHPEVFASEDMGATPVEYVLVGLASCLTAGIAAVAQNRSIQLKSVTATIEGDMDLAGHPRHRQRGPQRLQRHQGHLRDRCRREPGGHRGAGRPVAEALGGLRHRHQSDERHRRGEVSKRRPF